MFWSSGCSLLRAAEGFFWSWDVLYGGLGISKLDFWPKNFNFFSVGKFFSNFWSSKPWVRNRIRFRFCSDQKCWIQIRIETRSAFKPDPLQWKSDENGQYSFQIFRFWEHFFHWMILYLIIAFCSCSLAGCQTGIPCYIIPPPTMKQNSTVLKR